MGHCKRWDAKRGHSALWIGESAEISMHWGETMRRRDSRENFSLLYWAFFAMHHRDCKKCNASLFASKGQGISTLFWRNGEIKRLNQATLSLLIFSVEWVNSILKITSCSFFVSLSKEVFWSNQGRQAFFVIAIRSCWLFLLNQSHRPSVWWSCVWISKKSLSSNKRLKIGHYRNRRPSFSLCITSEWHGISIHNSVHS